MLYTHAFLLPSLMPSGKSAKHAPCVYNHSVKTPSPKSPPSWIIQVRQRETATGCAAGGGGSRAAEATPRSDMTLRGCVLAALALAMCPPAASALLFA